MKRFLLLLVFNLFCLSITAQIVSEGLVAYFPFNGNANDETGNGNDGTVTGATLTTDRFGTENSAYNFDGVNDWIEADYTGLLDMNDENFTISVFVKPSQIPEGSHGYIMRYGGNSTSPTQTTYAILATDDCFFTFLTAYDPYENYYAYSDTFNLQSDYESWHHLVCIRDNENSQMQIYMDGFLQRTIISGSGEWDSMANPRSLFIGTADESPGTGLFSGILDDIRIYNRILSESEISDLFHERGWTNIETSKQNEHIAVYPNPVTEYLNVKFSGNCSQITFELFDLQGRKIYMKEISNGERVDVKNLSGGLYFYNITTNEQKHSGKLIKNK